MYPLDFARTRLAVDVGKSASDRQFNGLWDCLVKIVKREGFFGLYWGFGMSVIGIIAYRGLYFGGFDTGKEKIFKDPKNANIFLLWLFA